MLEWIGLSRGAGWWITIASLAMLLGALIAIPLVVIQLPADYFVHPRRAASRLRRRSRLWLIALVAKNLLGLAFLLLGALMLVLPGQGLLTLLLAAALLDFPGKFRLQRWVIARQGVLDSLNWIRRRAGKPPLLFEPSTDDESDRPQPC